MFDRLIKTDGKSEKEKMVVRRDNIKNRGAKTGGHGLTVFLVALCVEKTADDG